MDVARSMNVKIQWHALLFTSKLFRMLDIADRNRIFHLNFVEVSNLRNKPDRALEIKTMKTSATSNFFNSNFRNKPDRTLKTKTKEPSATSFFDPAFWLLKIGACLHSQNTKKYYCKHEIRNRNVLFVASLFFDVL